MVGTLFFQLAAPLNPPFISNLVANSVIIHRVTWKLSNTCFSQHSCNNINTGSKN